MITLEGLPGGLLRLSFDDYEARELRAVIEELRRLLQHRDGNDPVDRRLFPDAYESRAESMEFKALVESDLVAGKVTELDLVRSALEGRQGVEVVLDGSATEVWLRVLEDLRLAIGVRIGFDEERMIAQDDPDARWLSVLDWLNQLQAAMLDHVMNGEDER